jgi:excisionase family DNA binding protein
MENPRYLTVPQLAQRWSVSLAHAYRVVDRGELPSMRVGQAIRIPIEAVEKHERTSANAA